MNCPSPTVAILPTINLSSQLLIEESKLQDPKQVLLDEKGPPPVEESDSDKEEDVVQKKKKKRKPKKKKQPAQDQEKPKKEEVEDPEEEELPPKVTKSYILKHLDIDEFKLTKERFQSNSHLRLIGDWKPDGICLQTSPPTLTIDQQFPNRDYPIGVESPYIGKNSYRTSSQEMREREILLDSQIKNLRKAAECHRQVRKWTQSYVRPGVALTDICNKLEDLNRYLIQENGLNAGIAFPTGCSLNNIAAHFSPNPGDEHIKLGADDVLKIDFGTHVEGRIIDCAFTVAFNPKYDNLIQAVKDATDSGLREAGIDVRLDDIGAAIQETMESYEITLDNRTIPIKAMKNLCGHTIAPYRIHAGKSVPCVKGSGVGKMEEGELYAIETFGSTGKGYIVDDGDCSHYMKNEEGFAGGLRNPAAKALLRHLNETYSTLAFCRRWLDRSGQKGHILPLKALVNADIITPLPPLIDPKVGSYVAQFEHTFLLRPTCKEVLSRGDDY